MPQANDPIPLSAHGQPCPCGSGATLRDCCLSRLMGEQPARTAEQLMRSRYTAHVFAQISYLWDTWSPAQRQRSNPAEIRAWATSCDWLGLQILATKAGQPNDSEGQVTFVALFRQGGQLHQHHEVSLFRQVMGRWFYIDHVSAE